MKIGIFGKNSYIGKSLAAYFVSKSGFDVIMIDSRNSDWKEASFHDIDVIICVVGIAHVSTDPKMEEEYYRVNRDMPISIAKKAKSDGVKHFIFFSSMIIYGDDLPFTKRFVISKNTPPNPANFYGKSKLDAENHLLALHESGFLVSILRVPMVYGPGCKGNFLSLVKIARYAPFFPDIDNMRSMIFIENLCEFVFQSINKRWSGILHPQNKEYISTKKIIEHVAFFLGKKIWFTKIFNRLIAFISTKVNLVNKVFGTKVYDYDISGQIDLYNMYSFEQSMEITLRDIIKR